MKGASMMIAYFLEPVLNYYKQKTFLSIGDFTHSKQKYVWIKTKYYKNKIKQNIFTKNKIDFQ